MAKLIGSEVVNGIRENWYAESDGTIHVERSQDVQSVVDHVAAINSEGAQTIDGLGKPVAEIPLVEAQAWAERRGIPWEKLLYSNEYDDEFKVFIKEHQRLAYTSQKKYH